MEDKFSAKEQMLGYFYQPLYALYKLLQTDIADNPDCFLLIENLDDIDFTTNVDSLKLIQTKHHIKSKGSISDKSIDLWKSLRIWSERIKNNDINLENVYFYLVTTATANNDSIAFFLRPKNRNTNKALEEIRKIAEEGKQNAILRKNNPELKKHENEDAYLSFSSLDNTIQKKFIDKIYIVDNSSNIEQILLDIKKLLKYACSSSDIDYFVEKLSGWFIIRVITSLYDKMQEKITKWELEDKIDEYREEFKRGSLPIDYENEFNDISEDNLAQNERLFIEQLKAIKVTPTTISNAICDYYKAYNQRGLWVRKSKILNAGLEEYDNRLIREWSIEFENMIPNINDSTNDIEKEKAGREVYKNVENKNIPICEAEIHKIKGHYIMRGSYHMLANQVNVGWHPDYKHKFTNERISSVSTKEQGVL